MLDLKKKLSTYPPKYAPVQNSFLLRFQFTNSKRGGGDGSLGTVGPGSIQSCSKQVAKPGWRKFRTCPRCWHMLHAAVLFQGLRVLGDSALVISPKGETTLTKQEGGYPLLPAFLGSSGEPFWGPQESLEAPMKTGPSQLSLWTEATLGPTHLGVECVYECACVCSRACARVQPVCPHILDLGRGGACATKSHSLSLAAGT